MSHAEAVGPAKDDQAGAKSARLLLLVLASAVFIVVANGAMVNVAVPSIQREYSASEGQVSWVMAGYLLVFAVGIPFYGRLADIYSLKRAFSSGLVGLAAGSLVCALAPNLAVLVAGRVVQAAGGAAIPALSSTAVAKLLPPGERGSALGLVASSLGAGAAVGPVVGGAITQFAGWQVLFYATLFLGLLLLPAALYVLPDAVSERQSGRRFDLPGGVLLALAAGLSLLGVTEGQAVGFSSFLSWGSFAGAAVAAVAFAWRIGSAPDPFVPPRLFRNGAFLACGIAGFSVMFANMGSVVLVPLLLSQVNGLPAGAVGLVLAPGAVAVAVLSPLAGRSSDRWDLRLPVSLGLALMVVSMLALSTFGAGASALVVAVGMLGVGVGFAGANSPMINAAAATLSYAEVGVGLGIYQMLFFLGGGFGPALLGAFLAFRREGGAVAAINPAYALDVPAFSDALLAMGLALLVTLVVTLPKFPSSTKRALL